MMFAMPAKILIVDSKLLGAENLRARLSNYAQVTTVTEVSALEAALARPWDGVVTDWSLGPLNGTALFSRLSVLACPLFLYTDAIEVEGLSLAAYGFSGLFNRLQRADLVLAVENALEKCGPSGPASVGPMAGNILLVEDSPTVRQYVKAVLQEAFPGQGLLEADDGRSALAAMKNSRVSLIITDLQMPGMDGLSFVQLLRNNPVLKRKPVLVLSGAVTEEARANLAQLEKVQVLLKPASPAALAAAVRSLSA